MSYVPDNGVRGSYACFAHAGHGRYDFAPFAGEAPEPTEGHVARWPRRRVARRHLAALRSDGIQRERGQCSADRSHAGADAFSPVADCATATRFDDFAGEPDALSCGSSTRRRGLSDSRADRRHFSADTTTAIADGAIGAADGRAATRLRRFYRRMDEAAPRFQDHSSSRPARCSRLDALSAAWNGCTAARCLIARPDTPQRGSTFYRRVLIH